MKSIKYIFGLLAIGFVCSMTSCDSGTEEYVDLVTVDILSPDASMKLPGDSIHFHVNFTNVDGGKIHNIGVEMYNITKDSVLYSFSDHVHADGAYEFHDGTRIYGMHNNIRVVAKTWDDAASENTAVSDTVEFHLHM